MYIPDINTLINLNPTVAEEYTVAGFYSPGDGGGSTFVWIEQLTGTLPTDDGGIIIRNTQTISPLPSGYFKRLYSGPINVRWFGAIMGGYRS